MNLDYVAEYVQISPEKVKDNLFGIRAGAIGFFFLISLPLWLLNYKTCVKVFAAGIMILLLLGWLVYRDETRAFRINYLYCGVVSLWLSLFSLLETVLLMVKEFHLDIQFTAQAFCGAYMMYAVGVFLHRSWALAHGHYTATYEKKKATLTAFFAHLVTILPGLLLILNVVLKRALGETTYYTGVIMASAMAPYFLLYLAVAMLHKQYVLLRYGPNLRALAKNE